MSHLDEPCEFPNRYAFREGFDIETRTLDAFCSGYARALLWADAYHVVHEDGCSNESPEPSCRNCGLEHDENASYAYDTPGRWWEGMGIDFSDAVSFLYENMVTLLYTPLSDFENGWDFWSQHGHDFLLTRNGHGTGFWDRGYDYEIGKALTDDAYAYGGHQVLTDDSPRVSTL